MPPYTNTNNMGSFIWVNNEKEAIDYPITANTGVLMMSRNSPVIFMKQADAYGRPLPLEVYDLVKRMPPEPEAPKDYVTTDQLSAVVHDLVKTEFDKLMK